MDIKWQRGKFVRLFAKMKIRIGGTSNTTDVYPGDEIEYDGSVVRHAGAEFPSPQLRSAVDQGWFSTNQDDQDGVSATRTASRNIAKATSINRDLSRVQRTDSMQTTSSDEDEIMQVSDRAPAKKGQSPRVLTANDSRKNTGMSVDHPDKDVGTPVEIGRVRVPTSQVFKDSTNHTAASRHIQSLENMTPRAQLFQREIEREGVKIRTSVGSVRPGVEIADQDSGEVVGKVRHSARSSSGDIEVKDTSNIRSEREKIEKPVKAKPKKSVVKTSPAKIDPSLPPRVKVALRVDPKFPVDWSFEGRLLDRLAAVKAHGVTQKFIQALYAAEGDQFRKVLEKEYNSLL